MKILVCGTNYGSTYIRALAGGHGGARLAGILSTGSERSLAYARQAQVPHYTGVHEIADGGIDIACVAVPGAAGSRLAMALLVKGIHVLCEHPMGAEPAAKALAVAQMHRRLFQINAHFADLPAPQSFYRSLAVAAQPGPALHFELAVNLRTLYSGLDLVGRALASLRDMEIIATPWSGDTPELFANLRLAGPKAHVSLLCQNFASAADDGSATLLNHRCSATFAHGNLLLAESNGPVLWFPSPVSMPTQHWRNYLPVDLGQVDVALLQQQRDSANLAAILDMMAVIHGQPQQPHQHPEYLQALTGLWERALHRLCHGTKDSL
ncbi:MAG: siderophore-like synthase [Methylococcaceae bacterium]|nr:MAG: siderophore-like synthase [Methylococcaceae bacterium]